MSPDVTCQFQGRLGNNLFQAAALIAYAHRNGLRWAIPATYRPGDIYEFKLSQTMDWPGREVWEEPSHGYTPIPKQEPGVKRILFGYYQSWKYFDDCDAHVRGLFNMRIDPVSQVSLHVRRGDYVGHSWFRVLPLTYYARATRFFTDRGQVDFCVFSDDIDWCKAKLPACNPEARFHFCTERHLCRVLSLMASCQDHIIANSSLSWFGAWFNPRPKVVITPEHRSWFGTDLTGMDTRDLLPIHWTQIPLA